MEKLKSCSFSFVLKNYKKYFLFLFLFLFLAVAIFVNGFFISNIYAEEEEPSEEIIVPGPITEITNDITEDTTWTEKNNSYVINSMITVVVGVTLTIEPGVVVKFDSEGILIVNGILNANGTTDEKIYFTSIYDDTVGGDTNADGESEGNKGDWGYIYINSPKKVSTINYLTQKYSRGGLDLANSSIKSDNYNIDNEIYLDNSKGEFTNLTVSNFDLDNGSVVSIDKMTFGDQDDSAIDVYNGSSLNLKNSSINKENYNSYIISIFTNSSAVFENVNITGNYFGSTAVGVFINSSLEMKGGSINNSKYGLSIFRDSSAVITDVSISCDDTGISVYNNSSLDFSRGSVSCWNSGIELFNEVEANISNTKITDASYNGIIAFSNSNAKKITVTKSEITGNEYGFMVWGSPFSANGNNIHDNFSKGAETFSAGENIATIDLDFKNNYWGDASGPTHSTNPNGLGDVVSDNILFDPWLKYDPLKENLSNIMFIHGFQASRIYKTNSILGIDYEDKLWEPNNTSDVEDMYMDENGESLDKNIYTKDLINEITVFGLKTTDIYKSFSNKLDKMVSDNEIFAWKDIAYDWRLSPLDVVQRGIKNENGNISYTQELKEDQVPYIISELEKLVDSSNNGKVTIVTHSNGGLVAKALITQLVEMKNNGQSNLIDSIDNLIVVAPPLLGTPKAMLGILHGYDQGMFFNIFLTRKNARDFGQSLPGAYGLLPSEKYLKDVDTDLIHLDSSLDKVNNWRSIYGESINTFEELKNFLLDKDKIRIKPSHDDLVNPTILNEIIFNKAKLLHEKIDNLEIPESIKIHQIAGFGLPTANDLYYKSKSECVIFVKPLCLKKKTVLSSDVGITSDGDGTVVGGSALFGEGEDYYLNLEEYNKDQHEGKLFYSKKDHASIFEVPYIYDLFHNILKNDPKLPEYITKTKPNPVDYTVLKMRSPIAMDIYDENGLHTGIVEGTNEDSNITEENIPNSLYMEIGEEKYIVVPKEGNYTLKLTGLADGIFTLEQEQIVNDLPGESVIFRNIPTTSSLQGEVDINSNSLATGISLDENGDGVFESIINPTDLSLAEKEDSDIIEKGSNSSHSSGSYLSMENKNLPNIINPINNLDNFSVTKIDNIIKNEKQNNLNKLISQNTNTKTIEKVTNGEEGNSLTASAGSVNTNSIMGDWKLIVVGGVVLLLFSLKFIFKLI